jgi:hypothetical protein
MSECDDCLLLVLEGFIQELPAPGGAITRVRLTAHHRWEQIHAEFRSHAHCRPAMMISAEATHPRTKPKKGPKSRVAACPVM